MTTLSTVVRVIAAAACRMARQTWGSVNNEGGGRIDVKIRIKIKPERQEYVISFRCLHERLYTTRHLLLYSCAPPPFPFTSYSIVRFDLTTAHYICLVRLLSILPPPHSSRPIRLSVRVLWFRVVCRLCCFMHVLVFT
jgi:hypothetical protein